MNVFILEKKDEKQHSHSQNYASFELDLSRVPHHIGIIMDGNRRWARHRDKSQEAGYFTGAESLREVIKAATEIGVKILTVYAFSTENWKRTPEEIETITRVLEFYLLHEREEMIKNGVKLETIGDLKPFSKQLLAQLQETREATKNGEKIQLILALNYGGRDEIRRASLKAFDDLTKGKFTKEEFTEKQFEAYLDTAKWGDPDLLIRTGGEMRLSNFLLWQLAYAEVVFIEKKWPDFKREDLYKALSEYQKRKRRLGK